MCVESIYCTVSWGSCVTMATAGDKDRVEADMTEGRGRMQASPSNSEDNSPAASALVGFFGFYRANSEPFKY